MFFYFEYSYMNQGNTLYNTFLGSPNVRVSRIGRGKLNNYTG